MPDRRRGDPITKEGYWLDPRGVARRVESYLKFTGVADTANFGPEAEFFVFDDVRFHNDPHTAGFSLDNPEAAWNSKGKEGGQSLGYHIRNKEGYVPLPPLDTLQDFRAEVANELKKVGIHVECHHHEVATAGQCEIDFRFSTLLGTDDICKSSSTRPQRRAPARQWRDLHAEALYATNGAGARHQSLWKNGSPCSPETATPACRHGPVVHRRSC